MLSRPMPKILSVWKYFELRHEKTCLQVRHEQGCTVTRLLARGLGIVCSEKSAARLQLICAVTEQLFCAFVFACA